MDVYVCLSMYMCVPMSFSVYLYECLCMYVCRSVCLGTNVCGCMCVGFYVFMSVSMLCVYAYVLAHVNIYMRVFVFECVKNVTCMSISSIVV